LGLFLIANLSTVGYALANQHDAALALCFGGNAICCMAILVLAMRNKRRCLRRHRTAPALHADAFPCEPVVAGAGGPHL
jgi:hypothetical protein